MGSKGMCLDSREAAEEHQSVPGDGNTPQLRVETKVH